MTRRLSLFLLLFLSHALWAITPEKLPVIPPMGMARAVTPLFIVFGSDDNMGRALDWFLSHTSSLKNPKGAGRAATFDGEPIKFSFYSNGVYFQEPLALGDHQRAHLYGHEIGNHTYSHIYVNDGATVASIKEELLANEALLQTEVEVEATWQDTLLLDTMKLPTHWAVGSGEYPDSLYVERVDGNRVRISKGRIYSGYVSRSAEGYEWVCDGKAQFISLPFDGSNRSYSRDDSLCTLFLKANDVWGYDYTELRRTVQSIASADSVIVNSYTGKKLVPGVVRDYAPGFRAPYLSFSDSSMVAIRDLGFRYDCSIEAGYEERFHSRFMPWPFKLSGGYPSAGVMGDYPELWEIPASPVFLPPDEEAAKYGIAPGLRSRAEDPSSGKLTGLDYNMVFVSAVAMDSAEYVATLKYTLDERLAGNRAPFAFGLHGQYYASNEWMGGALLEFIRYALTKPEVRIVSGKQLLDWMERPVALDGTAGIARRTAAVLSAPLLVRVERGLLRLIRPQPGRYRLFRMDGLEVANFTLGEEVASAPLWQQPLSISAGVYTLQWSVEGSTQSLLFQVR